MIRPKYTPEEALDKILLRMKYDPSKTLNENKGVVNEQTASPWDYLQNRTNQKSEAPVMTTDDIAKNLYYEIRRVDSREKKIVQYFLAIKSVKEFKEVEDKFKSIVASATKATDPASLGIMLPEALQPNRDSREIQEIQEYLNSIGVKMQVKYDTKKRSDNLPIFEFAYSGSGQTPNKQGSGKYKSCKGTYGIGCYSKVIWKAQECLGIKVDGAFGPKTLAAVKQKLGKDTFTDADLTKICGGSSSNTKSQDNPPGEYTNNSFGVGERGQIRADF